MLVALVAALTLGPAVLAIASRFGLLGPQAQDAHPRMAPHRHRHRAVARARPRRDARGRHGGSARLARLHDQLRRPPLPSRHTPANVGYAAAERHFSKARLNPELLMVETDHDMRNPADMIVLERVAKAVFHTPGIALVQSITRPLGTPIDHSSIPFQISATSAGQIQNLKYQQDRAQDMLKQVDEISKTIDILQQQAALQQTGAAATNEQARRFTKPLPTATRPARQHRQLRRLLPAAPQLLLLGAALLRHPVCSALRSMFDALDGIDELTDQFGNITASLDKLDALQPQLLALLPPQIATQQTNRDLILSNYATSSGINDAECGDALKNATAMGQAFDAAKNDDSFYLPPEAFDNPDFKRGLKLFLSPDGKAARMIITHEGDPATPEGISHIDAIKNAAFEAMKGTPLADAKIYFGGTAATYKDMRDGAKYDLLIAAHRRAKPDPADHDLHHPKPGRRPGHRRHRRAVVGRLLRACRYWFGSTSSASSCTGSCCHWPSSCCWPWDLTTTCC